MAKKTKNKAPRRKSKDFQKTFTKTKAKKGKGQYGSTGVGFGKYFKKTDKS